MRNQLKQRDLQAKKDKNSTQLEAEEQYLEEAFLRNLKWVSNLIKILFSLEMGNLFLPLQVKKGY